MRRIWLNGGLVIRVGPWDLVAVTTAKSKTQLVNAWLPNATTSIKLTVTLAHIVAIEL
jgi:hypothetical protein